MSSQQVHNQGDHDDAGAQSVRSNSSHDVSGHQQDEALNEWIAQLNLEASAAETYFQAQTEDVLHEEWADQFYSMNSLGYRRRKFANDGSHLHALSFKGDWEALYKRLAVETEAAVFSTERSTGFTFLHRMYANDSQESFPTRGLMNLILCRYPALPKVAARHGELPLHIACESSWCISRECERLAVCRLIKSHPGASSVRDRFHRETPLVMAIYQKWVVASMLEHNPRAASVRMSSGYMPVASVLPEYEEIAHLLLTAFPGAVFERPLETEKKSLLAHACECGVGRNVLRIILNVGGSNELCTDETTNALYHFWKGLQSRVQAEGAHDSIQESWDKAELLTKVAYNQSPVNNNREILLLHAAAGSFCPLQYLQLVAQRHPSQLRRRDARGRTPLMVACMTNTNNVSFYPDLFRMNIVEVTTGEGDGPISIVSAIEFLLELDQNAARVVDGKSRFPLSAAAESGKDWVNNIKFLVMAAPEALSTRDVSTHLYPFMLAGVSTKSSIDTVFQLLLECPEVVAVGII